MCYNDEVPEFMRKEAVKFVNKRFDITDAQFNALSEIDEHLKIPPSAIVRMALNCFLPKLRDEKYKYEGIKNVWNNRKF